MFRDQIGAVGTQRTPVVFATTCWQQPTFCAGAHAVECIVAREPPGAFSVPSKGFTTGSRREQRPWHARQWQYEVAVLCFCRVTRAAQPRAVQPVAGTAL